MRQRVHIHIDGQVIDIHEYLLENMEHKTTGVTHTKTLIVMRKRNPLQSLRQRVLKVQALAY